MVGAARGRAAQARRLDARPTIRSLPATIYRSLEKQIGRTKAQVLRKIKTYDIADLRCSEITSADVIGFAQALPVTPQTRMNYMSHLAAIFGVAKPMWRYPLEQQSIKDAFTVAKRMGITRKVCRVIGGREELDRLIDHFVNIKARRPSTLPMQRIIPFALFSTRRQEEIVRIRWSDYQPVHRGELLGARSDPRHEESR